jgi:hypothetical protein
LDRAGAVPLTRGLSGAWAAISSEFNRRVIARFPVGSSADDMAHELEQEGFTDEDWQAAGYGPRKNEHVAVRRESDIACGELAAVYWTEDRQGRLTSIRGWYSEAGCS